MTKAVFTAVLLLLVAVSPGAQEAPRFTAISIKPSADNTPASESSPVRPATTPSAS